MNLLIIGHGKESFEIRGKQLGRALGARLARVPVASDLAWADLVVLIKHAGLAFADQIRLAGKPVVWDVLDFWKQPEENHLTRNLAEEMLRCRLDAIRPITMIGATQAQASVGNGAYLPHHARPGLTPKPVRNQVAVVAYEGLPKYLGGWERVVSKQCERRGWRFVINPPDLSEADLIVAFRDGMWDGWMCREWKSGVKLVNALAAGRPVITQMSAAWQEIDPVGVTVEVPSELGDAFEYWTPIERRSVAAEAAQYRSSAFTLTHVAEMYRQILATL